MQYKVRRGDSLWEIAKHEVGDPYAWGEIAKQNRLKNPHRIAVGQILTLPARKSAPSQVHAGTSVSTERKHPSTRVQETEQTAAPRTNAVELVIPPVVMVPANAEHEIVIREETQYNGRFTTKWRVTFKGEVSSSLKHGAVTVSHDSVSVDTPSGSMTFNKSTIEQEFAREASTSFGSLKSTTKFWPEGGGFAASSGSSAKLKIGDATYTVKLDAELRTFPKGMSLLSNFKLKGSVAVDSTVKDGAWSHNLKGTFKAVVEVNEEERVPDPKPVPYVVPVLVGAGALAATYWMVTVAGAAVVGVAAAPAVVAVSLFVWIADESEQPKRAGPVQVPIL